MATSSTNEAFKKTSKMFYPLNLRKSCWAESGAVRHSSSGPQTVINRALSVWSHDTGRGTEVAKVYSSCTKVSPSETQAAMHLLQGKKGGQLESGTQRAFHTDQNTENPGSYGPPCHHTAYLISWLISKRICVHGLQKKRLKWRQQLTWLLSFTLVSHAAGQEWRNFNSTILLFQTSLAFASTDQLPSKAPYVRKPLSLRPWIWGRQVVALEGGGCQQLF